MKKQLLAVGLVCGLGCLAVAPGSLLVGSAAWAQGASYKAGDKAEGLETDGKWYAIEILRVEGDKYFVHWVGYDKKFDRLLEAGKIRPASAPGAASGVAQPGGGFNVGDKVEALSFGKFKAATVVSVRVLPASGQKKFKVRWDDGSGEYEVTAAQMRAPAFVNFSGKDFQAGQYVHVWYSNGWLETQVLEVKDGKIKIVFGGYGEKWFPFDDEAIRNKVREEQRAQVKGAEDEFIKEVAGPYYGYASAVLWATGDERFAGANQWTFQSMYGHKADEVLANLPKMAAGLADMAKLMETKFAAFKEVSAANAGAQGKMNADKVGARYVGDTYRQAAAKAKEGMPLFILKMNKDALDKKFALIKAMGEVSDIAGGGKGISFREGTAELGSPGEDKYEPGSQDVIYGGGKKFIAALKNQLQPLFTAAGLGEAEFAPVVAEAEKAVAEAKAAFDKNLPVISVNFPAKDATVEAFCKTWIVKQVPGAKVIKAGTLDADWKVWKNSIGIPESRTRWGGVVYKDPTTGLCAYASINAGQDYAAGKFSSATYFSKMGGAVFGAYVGKCK